MTQAPEADIACGAVLGCVLEVGLKGKEEEVRPGKVLDLIKRAFRLARNVLKRTESEYKKSTPLQPISRV